MAVLETQSTSDTRVEQPAPLDEARLNAFVGKAVDDWGTPTRSALVVIGDKLGPEHAAALGQVGAAYHLFTAMLKAERRIVEAFKTGEGMLWGEQDPGVFFGCERFFRPGYEQHLVQNWIPALDGVQAKLERGPRWPTSAAATVPRRSSVGAMSAPGWS